MARNLSLTERIEDSREQQNIRRIVHFNLHEIKERFDNSILDIENKFLIYEELVYDGKNNESKDILRSQIVFLEGVVDFYLHEMTKYSYYKMFLDEWDKTSQYKRIDVKMEIVEKGLNAGSSREWFFEYITDIFSRTVFLSYESMHDQLNAIGIPYNDVMHAVFNERTVNDSAKKGKIFISELFNRRNAIAHQIDRSHDSAIQNEIEEEYVKYNIDIVKKIAHEIFLIANSK